MPSILFGTNVISFTEGEIKKLQVIENGVYRKILGANRSTAVATLRGEIGASSMKTRLISSKLMYVNSIINGGKEILKVILQLNKEDKREWWRTVEKYMKEVEMSYVEVRNLSKEEIKEKTRKWDTKQWKKDLENKVSLSLYRKWKVEIAEESVYDNRFSSVLLFKAKTNTLPLNDRNRFTGDSVLCELCGAEKEDLTHFLLFCERFREERAKVKELQQPFQEDLDEVIGKFLFVEEDIERKKSSLQNFWKCREKALRARRIEDIQ